jgi:3-dehydroquinate dehydratase/shikimate dehydrogenase
MAELRRRRDRSAADLVELRLDGVADPDVDGALAGRGRPVIVTCRAAWEGGCFDGSEEERKRILTRALDAGADYVDVEWRAQFDDLIARTAGRRVIVSSHDFAGMPADLGERADAMRATGAEIVKIAGHATCLADCLPLLREAARHTPGSVVLIAMGEHGLVSRVMAARFGSAWAYAGPVAAVGQVSVSDLLDRFRYRSISSATALYGLTGRPIGHSVSPAMHNAAFAAAGLDAAYLPLAAADAADFATFGRGFALKGASITIPFKVDLMTHVDAVRDEARQIGAINTIDARDGHWTGGNTDAAGFLRPLLDRGMTLRGTRAAILGAGGAARAVAVALAASGARLSVHARSGAAAASVATLVGGDVGPWPPAGGAWDLLVNTTPVGMYPRADESPIPSDRVSGGLVYDLVYNPRTTRLMRDAATAGCATIGGLEMLVGQAEEQFAWWTGSRPSTGVMRAAAEARLAEFATDEDHLV